MKLIEKPHSSFIYCRLFMTYVWYLGKESYLRIVNTKCIEAAELIEM